MKWDYHNKFSEHPSSDINTKLKNRENVLLVMKTLRIYLTNFIYNVELHCTVMLSVILYTN